MPRQITAFSNPLVKQARGLARQEEPARRGAVPRRGPPDPDRGARGGRAARAAVLQRRRAPAARSALIDETEAAGGEAIETSADILHKISRQGQSAGGARRLPGSSTPASAAIDRAAAPLWIVAQALRDPGNLGTILQDRRRGRRRRADPDRRLRRSLFGRGGAGLDGRPVHPADRGGALGGVRALAARRAGPADRHQPQRRPRTIRRRATRSPPSSWSATSRPGCRRPMRRSATCW